MRAFAIRRGASVNDNRLIGFEQAMQIGHRGIEREKIVELECRCLALERQGIVAAQCDPVGITDRRDGRKSIQRASQNDSEKARVAPFGVSEPWQMGPGK